VDVPSLDGAGPGAGEIDFAEFDEVRIGRLHHVHDFAALVNDLAERNDFYTVNHK